MPKNGSGHINKDALVVEGGKKHTHTQLRTMNSGLFTACCEEMGSQLKTAASQRSTMGASWQSSGPALCLQNEIMLFPSKFSFNLS
jgi:hypothetical protein